MAFKMKGFPMNNASPVKQTYVTEKMRVAKDDAELKFNKKMNEEGFSSESNMKREGGASEELLALKEAFDKSAEGFIQINTENNDRAKAEKTGLYEE